MYKKWEPLQEGDIVDIVAPGMKPLSGSVKGLKPFLKTWGLRARYSSQLVGKDLLCANGRKQRFKDLKQALYASDSKMIWCLRGGYGSLHLLDELGRLRPPKQTKLFMGLSDITSLHVFLNQKWGWSTVHGAHIDRFALKQNLAREEKRFKQLLFAQKTQIHYKLQPMNGPAKRNKKIHGTVLGGNLITLQSSFGTPFQLHAKNKILFFEEIGERAYKVHRIFEHMRQLQMFAGVKAIVFGQFTGSKEPRGQDLVPRLLQNFADEMRLPVFKGLKSGHGPNQHPVPFGTKSLIHGGLQAKIELDTGAKV